ncbi:MAG: hypothetical protein U0271_18475 [Polyangiaceae bacterium]
MRLVALLAALVLLLMSTAAPTAWAAPSAQDKNKAKTEWTRGKQLASKQQHDQAVQAFRAAVDLDPRAQYQLDLARSLAETGALVEASELCSTIEATTETNTAKAKQAATTLRKKLEPRIPTLTIALTGADPGRATLTIDGQPAKADVPSPVDPGEHVVRGTAPERSPAEQRITVREGQHETVALELGRVEGEKKKSSGGGNMIPAAVLYAIGGAVLIGGGVTGYLAFDQTSKTEDECGGKRCPPEFADDVQLAQDYGTASTVLFAVGGLGVAAAIILTFTVGLDGDSDGEKTAGVKLTPYLGLGGAGVSGVF